MIVLSAASFNLQLWLPKKDLKWILAFPPGLEKLLSNTLFGGTLEPSVSFRRLKLLILLPDETKREEMVGVLETRLINMKRHDQIKPNLAR